MNIVVCVKQVPDTEVERSLVPGDNTVDRASVDGVINYLDEFAIEEGLKIAEAQGGEVTILSVGPAKAAESIRKALSMGADKAVHVIDDALAGSDALETSLAIAEALKVVGFDLVVFGSESTDARTGVVPAMVAERLGVPQLTLAGKVDVAGSEVTIRRVADDGYEVVTGSLPAVVSVGGEDQRAALPDVQGDHGGEEEAGADPDAGGPLARRGLGRAGERGVVGGGLRQAAAAGGGRGREGRRGRRQQDGRVPGRPEVHLRGLGSHG